MAKGAFIAFAMQGTGRFKAQLKRAAIAGFCAVALSAWGAGAGACIPAPTDAAALPSSVAKSDIPVLLLIDASNAQVLYSRSARRRFVPASVTKVMTLFTAFELIEAGKLDPKEQVEVSQDAFEQWRGKGSRMFLDAGDRVPLADLLTGIATVSANDASYVVAEHAAGSLAGWTGLMNDNARKLGMTDTHFATPNGWPDEGQTFTTASDLARLAKALIERHPARFRRFIGKRQMRYRDITQSNRDPMIGRVEGADGIKTGYTNEAGFNYLGTAKRGDQRLIVVVAGADRGSDRARAARDLIEWGFGSFDRSILFRKGARVGSARVQDGGSRLVELVAERDVAINFPTGLQASLEATIIYDGPLRAPLVAGQKVATLEINAPGIAPARIALKAGHSVDKAGFFDRIANAFARWLG